MLESYIKNRLQEKKILLMTHIVIGYPSLEASFNIVEKMVAAGVDLMELQIPFSEPMADGPVILKANQLALEQGVTINNCLAFAQKASQQFEIPFLYMTYYNILYKYGVEKFAAKIRESGVQGAIIPDLPPEEGQEYVRAMQANNLAPIFIYSPSTSDERMKLLADCGSGFIYCVARKGVTGRETDFSDGLGSYLQRCRQATKLPLAVGFGVKDRQDVQYLVGKADIAVIGSQTIRLVEEQGVEAVTEFISKLREDK
ncbi:MAG: tryptophan synthase subunit alpha [Deltaproteobacteria bacterium]|nr:tryptophan synthase subunit alpha [Deltaproteobacteria bacterium]MBT4641153.1 tryptophan synthase subunit alpha [Deltaproteobacteria bacterium]MBT6613001.1 tryptophan synthase subunit alpha [Deltaproteobacteria bacterium]MBT7153948.1 tryptophan synthase subunit alpha [Deltaproteobacteria bacterium]MBT7712171.1 tryptophan synthase subunit alpha [Deltaproteobacteria bacterium]